MRFSHFFIDRPIFAGVISIILTLVGAISFRALPITEYPDIAPPTVVVNATYAGASAEVIAQTVAAPIEQEINGVDNMLYVVSQSTGNGAVAISVVFKPGTNIDQAQVLVQNRVSIALAAIAGRGAAHRRDREQELARPDAGHPSDLARREPWISNTSPTTRRSTSRTSSPASRASAIRSCSARATIPCGSGSTPPRCRRAASPPATWYPALRAANVQVAAGAINQPPATSPAGFEVAVQTLGRLSSPDQFSDIVVATDQDGRVTRVRDIARVELGSQDYTTNAYLDNQVATAIGIFQRPGSNALATAATVLATMEELGQELPAGAQSTVSPTTPPSSFSNRSTR